MYMRNRPIVDNFPMGYNGFHDRPNMSEDENQALTDFNNQPVVKESCPSPAPVNKEKGFLSRFLGGSKGSDGEKGLIAGFELDDLILIGLMLLIFMDGGDEDILLVLAFLFFSGFSGFGGLGGLL